MTQLEQARNKITRTILKNVGYIGGILGLLVYSIAMIILVIGFKQEARTLADILPFAIINAAFGFVICIFLGVQGVITAKSENEELIVKYRNKPPKTKKLHKMWVIWLVEIIKWIFTKGLAIIVVCVGVYEIAIEGSQDYTMLLLALGNILMFVGFGFLALDSLYNKYLENVVPKMIKEIEERERKQ